MNKRHSIEDKIRIRLYIILMMNKKKKLISLVVNNRKDN